MLSYSENRQTHVPRKVAMLDLLRLGRSFRPSPCRAHGVFGPHVN